MHAALMEPIPLERAAHLPVAAVGGKAARLATLRAAGFAVPDGFVLTTAVYDRARDSSSATPSQKAPALPDEVRPSFIASCDRLGYPLIVRSSAVAEDLAAASFAGQFESVLHVRTADEAIAAVERCWRAAASSHLAEYRRTRDSVDGSLALLVQRQLAPESAGVAFGRDPVSGAERVVVEAVTGLADQLLDGAASPERWVVVGGTATRQQRDPEAPALRAADALRIAALVHRLGEVFGDPQDVEWAFAAGELNVVQSRPITTLASTTTAGPRTRPPVPDAWLRDRLHWPDRISPLGADIWAPAAERGSRFACDTFGLLLSRAALHTVDHRAYLEAIPFGGRRLPPPPPWLVPLLIRVVPPVRKRMARAAEAVRTDVAGAALERWRDVQAPRLAVEIAARRAIDLEVMDVPDLSEHLADTVAFFEEAGKEHYVAHFALAQVLAEYAFLARDLIGWDPDYALSVLGARSAASSQASLMLDEVATLLLSVSDTPPVGRGGLVLATLAGETQASAALHDYLDRFGARILGFDPMDRTLAEAPELLEPALDAAVARARARRDGGMSAHSPRATSSEADPASQPIPPRQRDRWLKSQT